jgi:hypothetical protein
MAERVRTLVKALEAQAHVVRRLEASPLENLADRARLVMERRMQGELKRRVDEARASADLTDESELALTPAPMPLIIGPAT